MIRVRPSYLEEQQALKDLWHVVFGDGYDVIDLFFKSCYQPERCLVVVEDDVVTTMLILLPMGFRCPDGSVMQGSYLYALATHPDHRGKGHGKRLVRYTHQYARECGADCLVVVPAQPSLYDFFGELDFQTQFSHRQVTRTVAQVGDPQPEDEIAPMMVEDYMAIRQEHLAQLRHVVYEEGVLTFQKELSQLSGGDVYRITIDGEEGCAAVECLPDGSAVVKELLVAPRDVKRAVAQLATQVPVTQFHLRTPSQWKGAEDSTIHPFGMVRWYNREAEYTWNPTEVGYLGLGLD